MFISLTPSLKCQKNDLSLGFWHLKNLSGELSLLGTVREYKSLFNDISEEQNSKYLIGGIKLNTNSYLWRPDIISFYINGEFNPETRNEKYINIPDRSEIRTLKKLDIRATIFSDKNINLSSYLNLNQSYFNRENLTNVRADNKQWGTLFSFNNKILPFSISYRNISWNQTETESGRNFNMAQNTLEGRLTKSFYGNDKHEIKYSHDEYNYYYADLNSVENVISRVSMNNNLFFDEERKYSYSSIISFYDQLGNYTFNKLEANERLIFHLPANLDFNANYNYYRMEETIQQFNTHRIRGALKHQLYQSLTTQVFADNLSTNHSYYKESVFRTGADIKYTKRLPFGRLNLGYNYFRQQNTMSSDPTSIQINREEHSLNDSDITLLDKAYVDQTSIIITDQSATIIYLQGVDYIINEINNFTGVIRVPGGQIAQDQIVLVNYTAVQPGSYFYVAHNNTVSSSIFFFERLFEIYYRGSSQNYSSVRETEFLTLNRYYQNTVGGRIYYKFATAGIEYDYFNSNIIPYKRIKYYLNINFRIKSKLLVSVNSRLRDYMLLDNDVNHRYANISGRIAYSINTQTRLNFEAGYLNQNGLNIDLDLITARMEIVATVRQFNVKAGVNYYNRKYLNSNFQFTGSYIKLIRTF